MKSNYSVLVIIILITANLITGCNQDLVKKTLPSALKDMKPDIIRNGHNFGGRAVAVCRHPTNNDELIVASQSGGLFKTTNHGVDWEQVSGSTTFWFSDVKYFPTNASIVIATANKDTRVVSGGGIWRSSNGGGSWLHAVLPVCPCSRIDNLSAYSIDIDPASNRIWIGTSSGLIYSDDYGITWIWLNQPKYSWSNNCESVESVIIPAPNHIKVVTEKGVRISDDNGLTWSYPNRPSFTKNGTLISLVYPGSYNELICSPFNDKHLFYIFQYDDIQSNHYCGLFSSSDNGSTWENIREDIMQQRIPFIKVVPSLNSFSNQIDVYYCNGSLILEKATFLTEGTTLKMQTGPWVPLNKTNAHEDVSDMAFEKDGKTPLLITTDGGVAVTQDKGLNWTQTGSGSHGFCALQINSLTGQTQGKHSDLYFTTQDNWTWASSDDGLTWPYLFGVEGSFIQLPRKKFPNRRILTHSSIFGVDLIRPLFVDWQVFPSVAKHSYGIPCLISPGMYIQNSSIIPLNRAGINIQTTYVHLTTDTGATWTPKVSYAETFLDIPKTSGGEITPVIYQAISAPGTPPVWNQQSIGIKRINDILGNGSPVISNVSGFGNIGSFTRDLADTKVFGVDPGDPNHLIVPDIIENNVKVTFDGGQTWPVDNSLTQLVTNSGEFSFSWSSGTSHAFIPGGGYSQITVIEFDQYVTGRILVGTMQAGVFSSCDNGTTWEKAQSSELIPAVSGFYPTTDNTVIISSYGRGLWQLSFPSCFNIHIPTIERKFPNFPVIYWRGIRFPLSQIHNSDICSQCGFFLVNDGDITEYKINKENNTITQVSISSGNINGYGANAKKLNLPFTITRSTKQFNAETDTTLTEMLSKNAIKIKGLYLDGNILKGLILSNQNIVLAQLPQPEQQQPTLFVDVRSYIEDTSGSNKLMIYGSGFDSQIPISIILDGVTLVLDKKLQVNAEGNFNQAIKYLLSPGKHTMLIEQGKKEKSIRAGYTFFIPIQEERMGNKILN